MVRAITVRLQDAQRRFRQIDGARRSTVLVIDDLQLLPLLTQFQHRPHEVRSVAVQPRRAQNKQFIICLASQHFAGVFALAINTERIWCIKLRVGPALFSVEHIVRADVDHLRAAIPASHRDVLRADGVDSVS